jgi:hydroxyethylthiazole kinase-like uncharacterized protein yjeF
MRLLTSAQMRAIEQAAFASGSVTGLDLMERAGRGVVEAVFREWPALQAAPHSAVILCGPGNNGGDGFVIARLLKEWGWEVQVYLYGDPEGLPPDARVNHDRWREIGEVRPLDPTYRGPPCGEGAPDIVFDAIFGTGMTRPLQGLETLAFNLRDFVELTRDGRRPAGNFLWPIPKVVAVDIPSGLCPDSGRVFPHEGGVSGGFAAHLTVAFHAMKRGHVLADGPEGCGRTVVANIGLRGDPPSGAVRLNLRPDPARIGKAGEHKYGHGHSVVLAGPMGRTGAARLAARGALRVGAGLVTVAAPGSAMMECAAQLTAIMLRKCDGAEGLAALLEDERLNALCLGPGLGVGAETRGLVAQALKLAGAGATPHRPGRSVVLDADSLTAFSEDPQALFDVLHGKAVLTPHAGEFARLFPDIARKLSGPATRGPAYSKVDATREAAARAGCVILFKGPDTVIADPSGRCTVNAAVYGRATPWLATAGSGDVLAGMITGLLARGLGPMEAAEAAAWLHVEAARVFGPGLIAEDLPEILPRVFRDLGL